MGRKGTRMGSRKRRTSASSHEEEDSEWGGGKTQELEFEMEEPEPKKKPQKRSKPSFSAAQQVQRSPSITDANRPAVRGRPRAGPSSTATTADYPNPYKDTSMARRILDKGGSRKSSQEETVVEKRPTKRSKPGKSRARSVSAAPVDSHMQDDDIEVVEPVPEIMPASNNVGDIGVGNAEAGEDSDGSVGTASTTTTTATLERRNEVGTASKAKASQSQDAETQTNPVQVIPIEDGVDGSNDGADRGDPANQDPGGDVKGPDAEEIDENDNEENVEPEDDEDEESDDEEEEQSRGMRCSIL